MANKQINGIKVSGVSYDFNITNLVCHLTSPVGDDYVLKVDNEGNLYADNGITPTAESANVARIDNKSADKKGILFLNEFYCGGKNANEHTLNWCSHNFVEIANISDYDINLSGASLQYAISDTDWAVLPLSGIVKAGSTFVIRGAQCSKLSSPTTKIIVDKFDMEWKLDNGQFISFDSEKSCKFYLTFNLSRYTNVNPYDNTNKIPATDAVGYIDLVGVKGSQEPGAAENKPYSNGKGLSNTKLFKRYYTLDPVSQATKATNKRNNTTEWNYVDLTKDDGEVIPCVEVYRPMAVSENKNLFFNKTKLFKERPSMITCSFGIQATDNTANNGNGATRCFNWITGNLDDRYIWIRTKGSNVWSGFTAFIKDDGRSEYKVGYTYIDGAGDEICICDSIIKEYTDDTVIIAYKFIKSGFTAGTYEYVAGKKNSDGTPKLENCTDICEFTVKTDAEVANGFNFVQTSDQQGFNWDEYRIWEYAGKILDKEYDGQYDFMINTGDMTQNGNRLGEWLDYFQAKSEGLKNTVEMATIGNNDLSLNVLYKIGNGSDTDKLWPENIMFYYTFEPDPANLPVFPVSNINYYMPSLYSFNYGFVHFICFNTEIKASAEQNANGYNFGENNYGNFYPQMKTWIENDVNSDNSSVKLLYCHEMPFTILTNDVVLKDPLNNAWNTAVRTVQGKGCNANTNMPTAADGTYYYWLSEFCQTHNIPLVFGGHKHTQSTSWPLLENVKYDGDVRNVDSMHPIIIVNAQTLSQFDGATSLSEATVHYYNESGQISKNFVGKYPNTWVENGEIKNEFKCRALLSAFEMEENLATLLSENYGVHASTLRPVIYAMSQATSYKHTSNKELPSPNIPWLRYYFPCGAKSGSVTSAKTSDDLAVNIHQLFPFFTVWNITPTKITGNVRKVYGAFNDSGKFDINVDGVYTRKGKCATTASATDSVGGHDDDMFSINGITSMLNTEAKTDTTVIEINI